MPRVLGLEITDSGLRGALVATALRRTELLAHAEVKTDPNAPDGSPDEALSDAQRLAARVQELVGQLPRTPDLVVLAMDGRELSLRTIALPATAAKRVGEVLPFELEPLLPFPIEEAIVDYQPASGGEGQSRFLAAAVPRARVAAHLDALLEAGLDPRELAVGAVALDGLVALMPELAEAPSAVVIDIGEQTTEVCFLRRGRCESARTLSAGLAQAQSGARGELESQLQRTWLSHRVAVDDGEDMEAGNPARVFLSGEAALHRDAREWLEKLLQTEVEILAVPEAPVGPPDRSALFARATALAGRVALRGKHLNLRQGEFAPRRAAGTLRRHARALSIGAAVVFAAFCFSTYTRYSTLAAEREALEEQLGDFTERLFGKRTVDPEAVQGLIAGRGGAADPMPTFDAFDALGAVSAAVPVDVKHETRRLHLEYDDEKRTGHLELDGTVASLSERDRIADNLQKHRCIGELEKGPTRPGPNKAGLYYRIEADTECPEDGDKQGRSRRRKNSARGRRGTR